MTIAGGIGARAFQVDDGSWRGRVAGDHEGCGQPRFDVLDRTVHAFRVAVCDVDGSRCSARAHAQVASSAAASCGRLRLSTSAARALWSDWLGSIGRASGTTATDPLEPVQSSELGAAKLSLRVVQSCGRRQLEPTPIRPRAEPEALPEQT